MASRKLPFEIGTRFGDWEVLEQLQREVNAQSGQRLELLSRVRCVCGTEKVLANGYLRTGSSKGCGCRRGRALAMSGVTHGRSYDPLYKLWSSIKYRIAHQSTYSGICMHGPWRSNFTLFADYIESLGPKPSPQHTLDRRDPAGDYAPGNLRWADKTEQSINRRNSMIRNVLLNSTVCIGQTYDMLTVLDVFVQRKHGRNWYAAKVQCACGTIKNVYQKQLLSPKTKSCGCFKRRNLLLGPKALAKPIEANGKALSMREHARQQGVSPHVIWNRIHKLGWETKRAITEPLRVYALIEAIGESLTVSQWEQRTGIPAKIIAKRIRKLGWAPDRAVTEPVRPWRSKETHFQSHDG